MTAPCGEAFWIDAIRGAFAAVGRYDAIDDDADAHLLRIGRPVLNVDASVAGVHFPWPCRRPRDAGRRAIVAAVSDLAATAALPRDLFLSLAWSRGTDTAFLLEWIRGMADGAAEFGLRLRGGNLTRAELPAAHVTVIGEANPGAIQGRGHLQPGDLLWLTGNHGDAALALALDPDQAAPPDEPELACAFWRPMPRLAWGAALAQRSWVVGITDVSDGWLRDLDGISRTGALVIDDKAVPRSEAFWRHWRPVGPTAGAWWGGEDWELAFATRGRTAGAVAEWLRRAGIPAVPVGEVEEGEGVAFQTEPAVAPTPAFGYDSLSPKP